MIKLLDILEEGALTLTPEERQQVEEMIPKIIDNIRKPLLSNDKLYDIGTIKYKFADGEDGEVRIAVGYPGSDTANAVFTTNDFKNRTDNWIVISQAKFQQYFPSNKFNQFDQGLYRTLSGNANTGIERLRGTLKHELIHAKDPALNHHYLKEPYKAADPSIYYKSWAEFQTMTGQFFESLISGTDRVLSNFSNPDDIKKIESALANILQFFAGRTKTISIKTAEFIEGTGSRNIFQKLFNFVNSAMGNIPQSSDFALNNYVIYLNLIKQYNPEGYKEFLKDLYKTIKSIEERINDVSPVKIKVQEKMGLTLEEKKAIAKFILKENKVKTLQEVKNNNNLLKEIKQNIQFYSGLKEHLHKNKVLQEGIHTGIGWIDNVLNLFGRVKDLMTGTSLGKWIIAKLKSLAERLFPKLSQDPNDVTDKIAGFFKTVNKWLGAHGIAYLIAAFKQRSFKPSKEAIEAAMPTAEKVYKVVLGILIAIATYKLIMFIGPLGPAALKSFSAFAGGGGGAGGTLQAGAIIGPVIGKILATAGIKGTAAAGFNVVGLVQKIKHLNHSEAEHEAEQIVNQELEKAPAEIDAVVR